MAISKSSWFVPTTLPAGRLSAGIEAAFKAAGVVDDSDPLTISIVRKLADGSIDERKGLALAGADPICDLRESGLSVRTSAGEVSNWHYFAVTGGPDGSASVHVETPLAGAGDEMVKAFLATTGLEPYIEPPAGVEDNDGGLDAPTRPSVTQPTERRLRAFLSFRFTVPENAAAAASIQRFLELLNVEVLTGQSYEPRALHEKVVDRLAGLDVLVLYIGADGQSAWTRDEIGTARAGGVPVIPVVQDGSTFEAGLFGDIEYITVSPGHAGDGFISLLEAITWIRRRAG